MLQEAVSMSSPHDIVCTSLDLVKLEVSITTVNLVYTLYWGNLFCLGQINYMHSDLSCIFSAYSMYIFQSSSCFICHICGREIGLTICVNFVLTICILYSIYIKVFVSSTIQYMWQISSVSPYEYICIFTRKSLFDPQYMWQDRSIYYK